MTTERINDQVTINEANLGNKEVNKGGWDDLDKKIVSGIRFASDCNLKKNDVIFSSYINLSDGKTIEKDVTYDQAMRMVHDHIDSVRKREERKLLVKKLKDNSSLITAIATVAIAFLIGAKSDKK